MFASVYSISSALLAVALAAPGVHAFFRMPCSQLITGRYDPLVNPGVVSGHSHQVVGGNGFGPFSQSFADARNSSCTSCKAVEDKSNYWTPTVYFREKNGQFSRVSHNGILVYYLFRGHNGETIHPFPDGLAMLAGNPTLRSYNASRLDQQAVSFVCLDYKGSGAGGEYKQMPDHPCPNGLRAQLFFPSCWDGKNLDSTDHKSHMAYPDGMDNGKCPSTHPVRLVSLFYEVIFDTPEFNSKWWTPEGAKSPYVLSTGDPTGYGFHGDFRNGWRKEALQAAIKGCTQESGVIEDCQDVLKLQSNEDMNKCVMQPRINERIEGTLSALPGCNPVTNGPNPAAFVQNCAVTGSQGANLILPEGKSIYLRSDIEGWNPVGCARDDLGSRALSTKYENGNMTVKACTSYCASKGFTYAGLEWQKECWCGNTLDQSRVGNYVCNEPCQGDKNEYCGAGQRLAVYKAGKNTATSSPPQTSTTTTPPKPTSTTTTPPKPTSTPTTPPPAQPTSATISGFDRLGCFADSATNRVLRGTSVFKSASLTPATCAARCTKAGFKFAGVEYGKECFCGNSLVYQTKVNEAECNTACGGDAKARCGAGNRILVYQTKATTVVPTTPGLSKAPAGFVNLGCFVDSKAKRVLPAAGTYTGKAMTAAVCTAHCASKNFKFSGLEYGSECFCANTVVSRQQVADSQCNMVCSGDAKSTCGAPDRIQIFQRNSAKRDRHARRISTH